MRKTESDENELPLKRELPSDDDDGMSDAGSDSQSTDENDSYVPSGTPKVLIHQNNGPQVARQSYLLPFQKKRTKKLQKRQTKSKAPSSFPEKIRRNRGRNKNQGDPSKVSHVQGPVSKFALLPILTKFSISLIAHCSFHRRRSRRLVINVVWC